MASNRIVTVKQLKQALAFFDENRKIRVLASKNELDAVDLVIVKDRLVLAPARRVKGKGLL